MAAGNERDTLLRVADRLGPTLGYPEGGGTVEARALAARPRAGTAVTLSAEDERLVSRVRESLARLAGAVGAGRLTGAPAIAVGAALDGSELVMRGELLRGNVARLPDLMESFVFLVTLPVVDQDEAVDLSRRTSELVERHLEGGDGAVESP